MISEERLKQIRNAVEEGHDFACGSAAEMLDEIDRLRTVINNSARYLDGIKYELSASVYTVEDDEFGQVFFVRDILTEALK